jgi:hypothetical protein
LAERAGLLIVLFKVPESLAVPELLKSRLISKLLKLVDWHTAAKGGTIMAPLLIKQFVSVALTPSTKKSLKF